MLVTPLALSAKLIEDVYHKGQRKFYKDINILNVFSSSLQHIKKTWSSSFFSVFGGELIAFDASRAT